MISVRSRYISTYFSIFYAQYKRCVKSEHFYWLPYHSLGTFTGRKVSGIYLKSNDIVLTMCMNTVALCASVESKLGNLRRTELCY
jgi:hypothetical protein